MRGARAIRGLAARAGAARLSAKSRRQRRRVERRLAGPQLIAAFAEAYPEAFFIEIGANDGVQHDFLRPQILATRWRGVMVEPVPHVFTRLRRNYRDLDRVVLEHAAIADRDGERPFFHLAEAAPGERLPPWYDAIGSFSRETVLGHRDRIPEIERRLVESRVPVLSFETLCRRHAVEELDLLLIDAEGYDAEILDSIDLAARHPRLLVFEHYHLSAERWAACRRRLQDAGYELLAEGFDTWCLDLARAPALEAIWSRLEPGVEAVRADQDERRGNAP